MNGNKEKELATLTKPTNEYERLRVSYIANTVCLLRVSAALVAILSEMRYKGYSTKVFEPMRKCKKLRLKIYYLNLDTEKHQYCFTRYVLYLQSITFIMK